MIKVGFVGAGKMAQALAQGFIRSGLSKASDIIASSPVKDQKFLDDFKSFGCATTYKNKDVASASDVVILATKPNILPIAASEISSEVSQKHLVISIAMGIRTQQIEKALQKGSKGIRVVRVMPNTPALVQSGASVYSRGNAATEEDGKLTKRLFESVGICEEVPEYMFDAVTGLSGSGPAYIYIAMEALADGGVRMGIPRDLAYKLAAQTVFGSAKMLLETQRHPGALKDDVCSPAGCTAEGLYYLEKGGLRATLIEAVEQATRVCREMGQA